MNADTTSPNPLVGLHPDQIPADWSRRRLDRVTDAELLAAACELLAVPHEEDPDSFALHAPLELMARAELLRSVSPPVREPARQRLATIASTWATTGTPVDWPDTSDVDQALDALVGGLSDGDQPLVDRAYVALCGRRSQDEIIGDLTDLVLPLLGGAAHGPIFLELLPRFRPAGASPAMMGRTLLRSLARHPDWAITWFDRPRPSRTDDRSLTQRLLAPKVDRKAANDSIYPTVSLVDENGLAGDLLGDVTTGLAVDDARRDLLRVAAQSMLQDEPTQAPYGWSHCLTMPQAALAIADRAADPQRAIDVAATYVLAFRAGQSSTAIDPAWAPEPRSGLDPDAVVGLDRAAASALAWHADPGQRLRIARQLIDNAAVHPDAHLAKYTLACLDAGQADPEAVHLYLAAAAHLAAWWFEHDRESN